jgi:hypothetical protein
MALSQELAAPGELKQNGTYDFEFKNIEKQYESYVGINVKLRYFLTNNCYFVVFIILFILESYGW